MHWLCLCFKFGVFWSVCGHLQWRWGINWQIVLSVSHKITGWQKPTVHCTVFVRSVPVLLASPCATQHTDDWQCCIYHVPSPNYIAISTQLHEGKIRQICGVNIQYLIALRMACLENVKWALSSNAGFESILITDWKWSLWRPFPPSFLMNLLSSTHSIISPSSALSNTLMHFHVLLPLEASASCAQAFPTAQGDFSMSLSLKPATCL